MTVSLLDNASDLFFVFNLLFSKAAFTQRNRHICANIEGSKSARVRDVEWMQRAVKLDLYDFSEHLIVWNLHQNSEADVSNEIFSSIQSAWRE